MRGRMEVRLRATKSIQLRSNGEREGSEFDRSSSGWDRSSSPSVATPLRAPHCSLASSWEGRRARVAVEWGGREEGGVRTLDRTAPCRGRR